MSKRHVVTLALEMFGFGLAYILCRRCARPTPTDHTVLES